MHVKVSLGLYLKNRPKTYIGPSQESWNIGDEPMTLDKQIHGVALTLAEFYLGCGVLDMPKVNEAVRNAAKMLLATADRVDAKLADAPAATEVQA